MSKKILKVKVFLSLGFLLITSAFFVLKEPNLSYAVETSSDAIAVRVIPNPNFYSALRWYQEQGFTGSPRSITVDGYEAVQEGRSVYVAASNVVGTSLYMNIYLISYTQEAETATEEIFNQILAHWKFNANIAEEGKCSVATDKYCLLDSDCPIDQYCTSQKSKIVRDTKRITNLTDIDRKFKEYKDKKGRYPLLSAGTYLPGKSLSVWPSWSQTLSAELGSQLPIDPINKLGNCGEARFDPVTCWDEKKKEFADLKPADPALNLPAGSSAYNFSTDSKGSAYKLCTVFESDYVASFSSRSCELNAATNEPPIFKNYSLPAGSSGLSYTGFIEASDPDGNTLTWSIDTSPATQWTTWSAPLVLQDVPGFPGQKKVYATKAGVVNPPATPYTFKITISDGKGGQATQQFSFSITASAVNQPPIFSNFVLPNGVTGEVYSGLIEASDPEGDSLTWTLDTSPASQWSSWSLPIVLQVVPGTAWQKKVYASMVGTANLPGTPYTFKVTINDGKGGIKEQVFTFSVSSQTVNQPPVFINSLVPTGNTGVVYNGSLEAFDPDGDSLTWSIDTSPADQWTTWSAPLVLQDVAGFPYRKTIYAQQAGAANALDKPYAFKVTLNDGKGGTKEQAFTFSVTNQGPQITAQDTTYTVSATNPLNYSLTAKDIASNYPLTYTITPNTFLKDWTTAFTLDAATQIYSFKIQGIVNKTINPVPVTVDYPFEIKVTDKYGAASSQNFNIKVVNNPPVVNVGTCATTIKAPNAYQCQVSASDADGNAIANFSFNPTGTYPAELTISPTGLISGSPAKAGIYNIGVIAKDEYGAIGTKFYNLTVTNDCTDQSIVFDVPGARADALVYDDNDSTISVKDVPGGTYLKISGITPTPYLWVANYNKRKVAKIRAYSGQKRTCQRTATGIDCFWVNSTFEIAGQLIGVYSVGALPLRTTVNAETGDVWVCNSGSATVSKLDIEGRTLKTCYVEGAPRGIAIEKNGDVWVANSEAGKLLKLSGDDANCNILKSVIVGGYPHGLASDKDGNVWLSNRTIFKMQKIDTISASVASSYNVPGIDGITVDLGGNVWTGTWNGGQKGVYEMNKALNSVVLYNAGGFSTTGITIDVNGDIWASEYGNNRVVKIKSADGSLVFAQDSGGTNPSGICGDSAGQVWVENTGSSNVKVFRPDGSSASFPAGDEPDVVPYTSSDMTGLNRSLTFRFGIWRNKYDGGSDNHNWGKINFQAIIPSVNQDISFSVRASNIDNDTGDFYTSEQWNALSQEQRVGRYLYIKIEMRSSQGGVTPVLSGASLKCL